MTERGMVANEHALVFECEGDRLLGVLATPEMHAAAGVVIVVGGPQYRAGSHRQFVLLARELARAGFAALRFDYRGIGDSEGEVRGFEKISADIAAAVVALRIACPSLEHVVLWGLCDGASAALMYADAHREATGSRDCGAAGGLVLVNPWVRSDATFAKTQIRHYYLRRLVEPSFWSKLLRGRVRVGTSLGELGRTARTATSARRDDATSGGTFQERMLSGLTRFDGPVLFLMSGRDLTAREFDRHAAASARWHELLCRPSVERVDIADGDHTFSGAASRREAERSTIDWLRKRFET